MEQWKKIEGYDCYWVSDLGRIKSDTRIVTKKNGIEQKVESRIIKPKISKHGYYRAALVDKNGKQKIYQLHRIVLIAFSGLNELKKQVNHINGNKSDNSFSNLEWVTCSENQKHAYLINLKNQKGEKHAQSRLTEKDVLEIRESLTHGIKQRILAEKYGVIRSYISEIKTKKAWNHI
jgi:hypothetical protein